MPAYRLTLFALITVLVSLGARSEDASCGTNCRTEATAGLEQIYLFGTAPTSRTRGATPAYADAGFVPGGFENKMPYIVKALTDNPVGDGRGLT